MRTFDSLSEKELLALAIALEEEDARIYYDLAEGLEAQHPAQAEQFHELRAEEDGHRHRLLDLYRQKFDEHIPLIRRQDVKGFVDRPPVWLTRPLGLDTARGQAQLMEAETKQFYESAVRQSADARSGSFWATWPRRSASTSGSPTRWEALNLAGKKRPASGCSCSR